MWEAKKKHRKIDDEKWLYPLLHFNNKSIFFYWIISECECCLMAAKRKRWRVRRQWRRRQRRKAICQYWTQLMQYDSRGNEFFQSLDNNCARCTYIVQIVQSKYVSPAGDHTIFTTYCYVILKYCNNNMDSKYRMLDDWTVSNAFHLSIVQSTIFHWCISIHLNPVLQWGPLISYTKTTKNRKRTFYAVWK